MNKVSLIESKSSFRGVQDSLKLIETDLREKLKNLKLIVIKINFVTTKIELATTPVDAVAGFIDFVGPFCKGKIIIAEEATFGNAEEGFEKYGFVKITRDYPGVEVFNSGKDKDKNIKLGKRTISLAKIYTKPNFIVSICRPKTHDSVVVTLSIKNLIIGAIKHGLLKKRFRIPHNKKLHKIITDLAEYTFPDLAIIDGTVGMEGRGPDKGTPVNSGWVLSSFDALAADSLATYLMGFNIDDVGYLNLLKSAGFGSLYSKDSIEILGEKPEKLRKIFEPHPNFNKQRDWR